MEQRLRRHFREAMRRKGNLKRSDITGFFDKAANNGLSLYDLVEQGADQERISDLWQSRLRELRGPGVKGEQIFAAAGVPLKNLYTELFDDERIGRALDRATSSARTRSLKDLTDLLPELKLKCGFDPLPDDMLRNRPTALLVADYGQIPFDPSGHALDALLQWAKAPEPQIAGRLYAADGGYGKTRLALEATKALRRQGWISGLITRQALESGLTPPNPGAKSAIERLLARRGSRGVFLAIDYAETRIRQLHRLAEFLESDSGERPKDGPIRIMLMARSAGAWWTDLRRDDQRIDSFFPPNAETILYTGIAEDRRRAFFAAARDCFAERLGRTVSEPGSPIPDEWITAGSPLLLAMAAYLQAIGIQPDGRTTLLGEIAREERRHWARALGVAEASPAPELQIMALVVGLTSLVQGLAGQDHLNQLQRLVGLAALHAQKFADVEDSARSKSLRQIGEAIQTLYGAEDWVRPVHPDILGEHIVGEALSKAGSPLLAALLDQEPEERVYALVALDRATRGIHDPRTKRAAVTTLIETVPARVGAMADAVLVAATVAVGDLPEVLQKQIIPHADVEGCAALLDRAPRYSAALLGILGKTAARDFALRKKLKPSGANDQTLGQHAKRVNIDSVRLSEAGRREEALTASEEAVKLYRELVGRNRDAFLPDLASALNNLGIRLSNLGRREEALTASEEAVKLYRELVGRNRDAFLPDLASALNNLGIRLSNLGRREEALTASEEAVKLYRELVGRNRDAFLPDLASALNNLGICLSNLGRREEALTASEEAVKLYRELVGRNRDAFLPDLATALNNLGIRLSNLGRREEALTASEEAVSIRRELVGRNRDAFLPDLAMALGAYGQALRSLSRVEDALAAFGEGLELLNPLMGQFGAAFGKSLSRPRR